MRNVVFDTYQRIYPLKRESAPVAIVVIDEASLAKYGQWPWPRTRLAQLVDRIGAAQPASIALDLSFPEEDRFSPQAIAEQLPILDEALVRALAAMQSNDERFADAIRRSPVVLGISAESTPDPRFAAAPRAAPVRTSADGLPALRTFQGHIGNVPVLDAAAKGHGMLNSGAQDQVVRVVPMVSRVQGTIVPSLGIEALRLAADEGLQLASQEGGLMSLQFGPVQTVLQDDGTAWLRFGRHDNGRFVSAVEVLEGTADPERFRQKVVLVGVNGLGLLDYKTTPLGEFVTGVEIHAQEIENLFNGVKLVRPATAPLIEVGVMLTLGLVLILLVPRVSALHAINIMLVLQLGLLALGFAAFARWDLLFDPVWPVIGITAVFGSAVVSNLSEAEKQRRVLRDQAARMAGEVDAARRIQMGLLPDPKETVGLDRRFELAAILEPARTVGGDFYDCFMIDARRLCVVVADVSGKGLPAALFMAAVKSHVKSSALRGGAAGEMLSRAQAEIGRENPEQLFVTAFLAVLEGDSGLLEYANAGHEPPFMRKRNAAPERLGNSGGPPLCVVEDFAFPTERIAMQHGQWLCIVTDGATEAMNPGHEFFGVERLRTVLSSMPEDLGPQELVDRLREEVRRFTDGAEAADDITLVALRWQ